MSILMQDFDDCKPLFYHLMLMFASSIHKEEDTTISNHSFIYAHTCNAQTMNTVYCYNAQEIKVDFLN